MGSINRKRSLLLRKASDMLPHRAPKSSGSVVVARSWEINGFSQVGAKIILTASETSCQTLDRVSDLDLSSIWYYLITRVGREQQVTDKS